MSDTEISYRYKDKFHPDIKQGQLTLNRGIFKLYLNRREVEHSDPLSKLERRLWDCGLIATSHHAITLLENIILFLKEQGWDEEDDDFATLTKLFAFLKDQDVIEFIFQCY